MSMTRVMSQGSVLGPQLFSMYVNDTCNVSKLLKFILFAEDTNLLSSHSHLPDLVDELCKELNKMSTRFCVNKLSMNIEQGTY